MPQLTPQEFQSRMPAVRSCVDAYFNRSAKKASLDRRIRNAVVLIAEGDRQPNVAVALGLYVAATEALTVDSAESVSHKFRENVATLLEPEGPTWPHAEDCIKKLYDARSKALHGTKVDEEEERRDQARLLSAATLYAILEFRGLRQRMGEDADQEELLFDRLREARAAARQVDGVTTSPARQLWGARAD